MFRVPKWYQGRDYVTLPVRADKTAPGAFRDELSVTLRLKGADFTFYIPTWAYDSETSTIPALPVWEANGEVLFQFPATALGTPQCSIPKGEVESWLKQDDR